MQNTKHEIRHIHISTSCNCIVHLRNLEIRFKYRHYEYKHRDKSNFYKHLFEHNHTMTQQNNIAFYTFVTHKHKH